MSVFAAGSAGAAEPTLYELPKATHAFSLSAGADGTLWWAPSRGTEYRGASGPVLGEVSTDGAVGEQTVSELRTITGTAVAPDGSLWLAAWGRSAPGESILEVAHLSTSGQLEKRFIIRRGRDSIESLTVGTDAIWLIARPYGGPERIERVSTSSGVIRRFALGRNCESEALAASGKSVWFTEACDHQGSKERSTRSSIVRIGPDRKMVRHRIAKGYYPVSLARAGDGVVWFGARGWDYRPTPRVGRITEKGRLVEYRIPHGLPDLIAVGAGGRLWFPISTSEFDYPYRSLTSIGAAGDLGMPVCAEPECLLEPTDLVAAPDGGLWYALRRPNPLEGGGGSQIAWSLEIGNEAGFIAHLAP